MVTRWLAAVLISTLLLVRLNCGTVVFVKNPLYIHPENCCHYVH